MRTVNDDHGVPSVMVRLPYVDREGQIKKEIITDTGEKKDLFLRAPNEETDFVDRFTQALRFGIVEAVGEGCGDIKVGDIAVLDYLVDANTIIEGPDGKKKIAPHVIMEGLDRLVTIPAVTTYHKEDIQVKNGAYYAKEGDVDQIGMVLAVIRDGVIRANPHYVFCDYVEEVYSRLFRSDNETHFPMHNTTHIRRTVTFAHPDTGFFAGDEIIAEYESNITLNIFKKTFDIIPFYDIHGVVPKK